MQGVHETLPCTPSLIAVILGHLWHLHVPSRCLSCRVALKTLTPRSFLALLSAPPTEMPRALASSSMSLVGTGPAANRDFQKLFGLLRLSRALAPPDSAASIASVAVTSTCSRYPR